MKKERGKRMKTPLKQTVKDTGIYAIAEAKQKNFLIFSMLYSRPFLFVLFFLRRKT